MIDIVKSIDRFFNVDIFLVGYKIFYELIMVNLFLIFYEDFVERKRFRDIYLYNCCIKINYIFLNLIFLERVGI